MTEAAEALDPQTPPEQPNPRDIARAVAMDVADAPEQVGEVVDAIELDDNVTDFRLAADVRGYEGWQWSVTLYHDVEVGTWTVNESSLVPTDSALVPPAWIPWKDRLEPTDLAPTDSIGTDPDDPRLEGGFRKTEPAEGEANAGESASENDQTAGGAQPVQESDAVQESEQAADVEKPAEPGVPVESVESAESAESGDSANSAEPADPAVAIESAESVAESTESVAESTETAKAEAQAQQTDEIVEEFALSRRHVLSPKGRAQVAKRWYEGPRGPKAMSTKTADGNLCSTCGFFVPLKGELNRMFGVCANKWSPDDGRVVSLDHGCGEHSEIEPPEPSHLWVQSKPAYDDFHIDVIAQKPRDERGAVEAIEQLDEDAQDSDEATEEDILANTEPDTGDDEPNETQPAGVEASAELEAVIAIAEGADESDESGDAEACEAKSGEAEAGESEPAEAEADESTEPEVNEPAESAEPAESTETAETVESVVEVVTAEAQAVVEGEEAPVEPESEEPTADEGAEEPAESGALDDSEEPITADAAVTAEPAESAQSAEVAEQTVESEESVDAAESVEQSAESVEVADQSAEVAESDESTEPTESSESVE